MKYKILILICLGFTKIILCQDKAPLTNTQIAINFAKKYKDSIRIDSICKARNLKKLSVLEQAVRDAADSNQMAVYHHGTSSYEHYIHDLKHREKVYDWQLTSSRLIFLMVILIVMCGIIFSGIHFYISIQRARNFDMALLQLTKQSAIKPTNVQPIADAVQPGIPPLVATDVIQQNTILPPPPTNEVSSVELSKDGIKLTSSILGVIILGLSLAFFYLYLSFVYKVNESSIDTDPKNTPVILPNK